MNDPVSSAIADWSHALGDEAVLTDQHQLERLLDNVTGFHIRKVVARLRPTTVDQVVEVIRIARRHRSPVYPYSTGMNWSLGSRLPNRDGGALLDLGALNRIREVDVRQHYAIVEPGVTQRQLADHIRAAGLPLLLNVTGASPESGLIGNLMERGTGFRRHRVHDLRGVEVVLGTGQMLRSGFWGQGTGKRTVHHYRQGVGPDLGALFSQSNFGVVTAAVVDLIPRQPTMLMLDFRFAEDKLGEVIDDISEIFDDGTLRSIVHILNNKRIMTMAGGDATIPMWTGFTAVDGTPDQVEFRTRRIRVALERHGVTVVQHGRRDTAMVDGDPMIRGMYDVHDGRPTTLFMDGFYQNFEPELRPSVPHDPDRSDCGLLACLPVVPLDSASVRDLVAIVENVCDSHGIVPAVALNPVNADYLEAVINIYFTRSDSHCTRCAHECNRVLHSRLYEEGFRFYRADVENMQYIMAQQPGYWTVVRALKGSLDPDGIVAPGRYCP